MSIKAKMYVDDLVYNIRRLDFGFDQKINTNGTASTQPLGGLFNIEVESPKNTHLYAWGASNLDMKYVKLVFSPVTLASKSRTIELYDTLCIRHHDHFHHESKDPMISVLQLSPAIIVQDGQTMFEKNWKVSDLSRQNVEATPVALIQQEEPKLVDYFITDLNGHVIEEYNSGEKILLQIKTENRIGENLTIQLNDKTHDFKYKGVILANDTLTYIISDDLEKVELEVIDQEN
ncbi:MAG: type VI secretion system tube protein TssD [Labilibaculum antarcticum]